MKHGWENTVKVWDDLKIFYGGLTNAIIEIQDVTLTQLIPLWLLIDECN